MTPDELAAIRDEITQTITITADSDIEHDVMSQYLGIIVNRENHILTLLDEVERLQKIIDMWGTFNLTIDKDTPTDTLIFKDNKTGKEVGRIENIAVDKKGSTD